MPREHFSQAELVGTGLQEIPSTEIPGTVSGFLRVKWCGSEIRSSLWSIALLGGTARKVPSPSLCTVVLDVPELSGISCAFRWNQVCNHWDLPLKDMKISLPKMQ